MTKIKKNTKPKGFQFEDYLAADTIEHKNKIFNIVLSRLSFVSFFFLTIIFVLVLKFFYLGLSTSKASLYQDNNTILIKERADILDRNNTILARNVDSYSVAIRSKLVKDEKKLLINLRLILPNLDVTEFEKNIKNKNFFYIKKTSTDDQRLKLWLLGDKSIYFEKKQIRIYPQKNLFSHVIGQTDYDNHGISGLEKYFDSFLKNNDENSDLTLTLDSSTQHIIREELLQAQKDFDTIGSGALLMNIHTGEIISMMSLPDYDLNRRFTINNDVYTNKITKGVYELGSVFKTFTLAAGLENNVIKPKTIFKNLENSLKCDKFQIKEHDKLPVDLSAEQILIRSSNIGAIRIVQKVGLEKYKNFLNSLEIFKKIKFELEEIGTPIKFRWGKCKLLTASFGHGITTTPLQLAKAYAIISNGGYKITPTIIKKDYKNKKKQEKVISLNTSLEINKILRKVVSLKEGTANFADINGYEVGGKTGTAYKSFKGRYSQKKINTFVSIFPISNPKYVLLIILDEPKPAPNLTYITNEKITQGQNRNEAGWNAVYVAGKIIEKIGPILATKNLHAFKNF